MNKRKVGTDYEEQAAAFLQAQGMRLLERNYRCRIGEIDLIAFDPDEEAVVFVEVKYRAGAGAGRPEEAVTETKQRTICRVADHYRMRKRLGEAYAFRFDVIAIEGKTLRYYRNAFAYD
uniref:YraN family protein n=1 Tax=Eubacterium cellulosolvens TaxID=29322 RepID=UPI000482281E|nr:YraN family protein [[Eubacterium] cellulosolvens]